MGFLVLQEGSWEGDVVPKDHVKALTSFFKKIKVDVSMVAALPVALGRKPAERSEFDSLVASELEQKLEAHLQKLAQTIENNVAANGEKNTAKDAIDEAFTAAKTQQKKEVEALLELRAEQKQLSSELSEKQQAVIEQEFAMKAVDGEFQEEKVALESHQRIVSDLTELLERTVPIPEVAVEEEAADMATEVMTEVA